MLQHQVKSFSTGLLTKIRQQGNIPAKNGLQARSYGAHDRPRPHHNSAHYAECANYPKSVEFELRGHHGVRHHGSASWVSYGHETISCLMRSRLIYTLIGRNMDSRGRLSLHGRIRFPEPADNQEIPSKMCFLYIRDI